MDPFITRLKRSEKNYIKYIKLKKSCVEYKKGKCEVCGYNKCLDALQFHHTEPDKKDFNISSVRTKEFNSIIQEELDKCSLLCSNCHAEEHYKLRQEGRLDLLDTMEILD